MSGHTGDVGLATGAPDQRWTHSVRDLRDRPFGWPLSGTGCVPSNRERLLGALPSLIPKYARGVRQGFGRFPAATYATDVTPIAYSRAVIVPINGV